MCHCNRRLLYSHPIWPHFKKINLAGWVRDKRDVGLEAGGLAGDRGDGGEGQEQPRDRTHQDTLEGEKISPPADQGSFHI